MAQLLKCDFWRKFAATPSTRPPGLQRRTKKPFTYRKPVPTEYPGQFGLYQIVGFQ